MNFAHDAETTVAEGLAVATAPNGVVALQSAALTALHFAHGFTTRIGGVSTGKAAALNFGLKNGDAREHVAENTRRLATALGIAPDGLYRVTQVHGTNVVLLQAPAPPVDEVLSVEADALVTTIPGTTVGVVTADCVPVLFADCRGRAVAAAHAGWRGLAAGVLQATVQTLEGVLGGTESLVAAIGPCISAAAYEVGEDVAQEFAAFPGAVRRDLDPGTAHLDLRRAARQALVAGGLTSERIVETRHCTALEPAMFFSFRRDGVGTGLQLSAIAKGGAGLVEK